MLAVAGWLRYLCGYDLNGGKIRIDDIELLTTLAAADGINPDPLLRHDIFAELRTVPGVADRLHAMITDIDGQGVIGTLREALGDHMRELVLQ
jgi:mannitol 2-dehydrogenase